MSKFQPIEFSGELRFKYWEGRENALIRYWVYLKGGLALVNEAKNYLLLVFGSFWTAKVVVVMGYSINPNWILLLGVLGIPVLIYIGRWQMYRANKPQEYMTQTVASITGYQPFNMTVAMVELQEGILEELKKLNELPR